jgi:hypothetical protein
MSSKKNESPEEYVRKLEIQYNKYVECINSNDILFYLVSEGLITLPSQINSSHSSIDKVSNPSTLRKIINILEKKFINSPYITEKEAHSKLFDIEVGIANHLYGTPITSGPTTRTYKNTPHQTPQLGPIMPLLPVLSNDNYVLCEKDVPKKSKSYEEFMRSISAISVESAPYVSPQLKANENSIYNVPYLLLGKKITYGEECFSDSLSDDCCL